MTLQTNEATVQLEPKLYKTEALSEVQLEAVNAPLPTIVLAAAGTGKTATIIHRIAKAYRVDNMTLDAILGTTFTRKASQEMSKRLHNLIGAAPQFMGTYHRNSLLLIKKYPVLVEAHGYNSIIELIDATDRDRLLSELLTPYSEVLASMTISKTNAKKWMREGIDSLKGRGFYPIDYANAPAVVNQYNILELTDKFDQLPAEIAYNVFKGYQESLRKMNLLDFDDVMALPVFAMRDEQICKKVSQQFKLVLVDEFQDCSALQFEMAEQLSSGGKYLYLVGDEDQLIYGWRDASLQKVMNFYENPNYHVHYLEENYRSNANIIDLAVPIITQNKMRSKKVMRAVKPAGKKVLHVQPYDTDQEARYIVGKIKKLIKKGTLPSEIAVIYRTNSYATRLEAELVKKRIDYDVVKAYNFFEYREIKNCVSYLRLALDTGNEMAFKRIINWPKRKNGEVMVKKLAAYAHKHQCTLYEALKQQERISVANQNFIYLIDKLSYMMHQDVPVKRLMDTLIKGLDMEMTLFEEHGIQEGELRLERVKKLSVIIDVLKEEHGSYPEAMQMLNDEMANTNKESKENKVQLMTIHGSKGLEFEHVFIVGAVNGMMPSLHGEPDAIDKHEQYRNTNLEEERRLFYVAVTRAKDRLTISSPKYIHRFGSVSEYEPTMFLDGLQDLYKVVKTD
jgi:DNA helicase-2/ATP-dependent DNA helicase PcrA